jgi:hypothetical protein
MLKRAEKEKEKKEEGLYCNRCELILTLGG